MHETFLRRPVCIFIHSVLKWCRHFFNELLDFQTSNVSLSLKKWPIKPSVYSQLQKVVRPSACFDGNESCFTGGGANAWVGGVLM